jgi:hypothetical protein
LNEREEKSHTILNKKNFLSKNKPEQNIFLKRVEGVGEIEKSVGMTLNAYDHSVPY